MRDAIIDWIGRELYVTDETPARRDSFIAKLADELLAKLIRPISGAAPPAEAEEPIVQQLYCPEQGGWHTGIWWADSWRLSLNSEVILLPTHFAPALPKPDVDTGKVVSLARRRGG